MDTALFEYLQSYLTPRRKELFDQVVARRSRFLTVVTEDVYQLHNSSAVMRSCEVFGVQDVHIIEENLGKKLDREIAMGAQKWIDVHRHSQAESCMQQLREQGYQLIATTPHNDSCLLETFELNRPVALFFGKEKEGVSPAVMEHADGYLKIPMYGFTESLNISVSAAIIIQELTRRMRAQDLPWQLSEQDQRELLERWTMRSIKSVDRIIDRFYKKS